ncbi:hypothetical protein MINT15_18380 [Saccharomonospora viridis]|uniref:Uncharacterized protein n=1 Tax=Saccharomonospora viridis TaxID=1852 RepID=A0A837DGF4_9PSEU|nr:hypothetical protein MINT15_18380 [Saccharomonospora viridis]
MNAATANTRTARAATEATGPRANTSPKKGEHDPEKDRSRGW